MLIEEIIIKMNKTGTGVSPEYSLTIYGYGTVIYSGIENVRVKGKIEESISEGKVMALLSEFKDSGFFTFENSYSTDSAKNRPNTVISISMLSETRETISKTVSYNPNDVNAPEKLKKLENKIDEIIGSEKWVDIPADSDVPKTETEHIPAIISSEPVMKLPTKIKKKKSPKTHKKKPVKAIIGIIAVIVILCIYILNSSIINFSSSNNPSEESNLPNVGIFSTASSIDVLGNYEQKDNFKQGDTIYFYLEYSNISTTEGDECDISFEITALQNGLEKYKELKKEHNIMDYFKTEIVTDDSWSAGSYEVEVSLFDNISKKSVSAQTTFNLEKTLKIVNLSTYSFIGEYLDEDLLQWSFNQGDPVYIYQEHADFTIDKNGECNLTMELVVGTYVNIDFNIKYTNIKYEGDPDNNARRWWFPTDDTWPTGVYYVTLNLTDNLSLESIMESEITAFNLI